MTEVSRRKFVKDLSIGSALGASVVLSGCNKKKSSSLEAPSVVTKKHFRWRMVTTWPPHFPVMGEGADLFAKWVESMSNGRLTIQVYGGGELVPALQAFDAVSQGSAEMGHGASYYWAGKSPAAQFFAAVPFGMNAQQMNAWLYGGDGLKLWQEVYAPFKLVPMPVGNSGTQMGGWFNKEINSIADVKGLKMRIPGLGGKVIAKAGGSAVLSAGGEIYTNLERGVIDATEWVGPYHDYKMGFHKIAKYYYYPGWHEPGTVIECFINKSAFDSLSEDLITILQTAAYRSNIWMLSEFEAKNNVYLKKLVDDHNVSLKKFPDDVLSTFKSYSKDVIGEIVSKDAVSKKVYESFTKFRDNVSSWANLSEKAYHTTISD